MSKPSFSNIDLWLFEYAEGNLSPDQEAQLELFILQHPELEVDRDMWEMAQVQQKEMIFAEEESLYRRKPVGAYWAIGGSMIAASLLFFGLTAYFAGTNNVNQNPKKNITALNFAEENPKRSKKEIELQKEIAGLKGLVISLESELQRTRGRKVQSKTELSEVRKQKKAAIRNARKNDVPNATSFSPQKANVISIIQDGLTDEQSNNSLNTSIASSITEYVDQMAVRETNGFLRTPEFDLELKPIASEVFQNEVVAGESRFIDSDDVATEDRSIAANYDNSNRFLVAKFMRKLRRMANNPIALKNSRDPYHHVPGMSSVDLNFGATGTMIAPRMQTLSRLQWQGLDNEMFTNQLALDGYVYGLRGGIGVQMTHNYYNQGGIQTGEVALTYSPKLSVNQKISIEPAIRLKMGNKILDANRMSGQSQVEMLGGNAIDYYQDGTAPVGTILWYRDLGLGLNVNTEWFYVSAQVDNLFNHRDNIYSNDLTSPRRAGNYFAATIGTDWESNDSQWETNRSKLSLSPYLVYRKFESVNEIWTGATIRAYWLTVGASISSNMDPAASLGIVSSDKRFSLVYNADYMRSIITNERSLSHQLTLRIVGKQSRSGRRILNH